MEKNNYKDLTKEELLVLINNLEKSLSSRGYGLKWDCERVPEECVAMCQNNLPYLLEIPNKNIVTNNTKDNIFIIGENYHALQCLSYTHNNAIDFIYIDPPYNTLKDGFMYNDIRVNDEDEYRHSKWLNFMDKRLQIAYKLLADDGIIAISIDDNEFAQLKLLCDQIFGEHNLLDVFHIQVRYEEKSLNDKDDFHKVMEYILLYAKNKKIFKPNKPKQEYEFKDFVFEVKELIEGEEVYINNRKVTIFKPGQYEVVEHKKGNLKYLKSYWASGSLLKSQNSAKFCDKYLVPRKNDDGLGCLYKVEGLGDDGLGYRYFLGPKKKSGTRGQYFQGVPLDKIEELMTNGSAVKYESILNLYDYSADFGNIKHEGGVNFPGGKKPIILLKNLINIHPKKDAIVLDFFAGSGSTGHAVLDLNNEDGGNRQFILCTNNEVEEKKLATFCSSNNLSKDDFYHLLRSKNDKVRKFVEEHGLACFYTYPRLKNVICGFKESKKEYPPLYGNLKCYETDLIPINNINLIIDKERIKLTNKAGELISIKENTFVNVYHNDWYQIYCDREGNKYAAIYYREDLEKFDELIEKIGTNNICSLYIYSSGKIDNETYSYLTKNFIIKDIPQPILDIYKSINMVKR